MKRAEEYPEGDFRRGDPRYQGENFDANVRAASAVREVAATQGRDAGTDRARLAAAQGRRHRADPRHEAARVPRGERRRPPDVRSRRRDGALDAALAPEKVSGPRYSEKAMATGGSLMAAQSGAAARDLPHDDVGRRTHRGRRLAALGGGTPAVRAGARELRRRRVDLRPRDDGAALRRSAARRRRGDARARAARRARTSSRRASTSPSPSRSTRAGDSPGSRTTSTAITSSRSSPSACRTTTSRSCASAACRTSSRARGTWTSRSRWRRSAPVRRADADARGRRADQRRHAARGADRRGERAGRRRWRTGASARPRSSTSTAMT